MTHTHRDYSSIRSNQWQNDTVNLAPDDNKYRKVNNRARIDELLAIAGLLMTQTRVVQVPRSS